MSQASITTSNLAVIPPMDDDDRRELLTLARRVINESMAGVDEPGTAIEHLPPRLQERGASFVTLRRGADLLGTVGSLDAERPVGLDVAEHALSAAFADPRVPPVTGADLDDMSVEVSVLGPLVPTGAASYAELLAQLRPHVDGVVVGREGRRVTFLPAVWDEVQGAEDFLALLWRKAGISQRQWPADLKVWTYRTETLLDRPPG